MPLFRRRPRVDPAEVAALREELSRLRSDLDHRDVASAPIVEPPATQPTPTPPPPPPAAPALAPPGPGTSLDELRAELGMLAQQLTTSSAATEQLRALATSVGARLDGLAAELASQIDELAGEIESLHQRVTATASVTPEDLEALRAGQVRLANEQARYEIAFRQDLAQLADDLRRPRS
jgi:hypothetical protein